MLLHFFDWCVHVALDFQKLVINLFFCLQSCIMCVAVKRTDLGGCKSYRGLYSWSSMRHSVLAFSNIYIMQIYASCSYGNTLFSNWTVHLAEVIVQLLHCEMQLLTPKLWLPNSPGPNSVDCFIWGWTHDTHLLNSTRCFLCLAAYNPLLYRGYSSSQVLNLQLYGAEQPLTGWWTT